MNVATLLVCFQNLSKICIFWGKCFTEKCWDIGRDQSSLDLPLTGRIHHGSHLNQSKPRKLLRWPPWTILTCKWLLGSVLTHRLKTNLIVECCALTQSGVKIFFPFENRQLTLKSLLRSKSRSPPNILIERSKLSCKIFFTKFYIFANYEWRSILFEWTYVVVM